MRRELMAEIEREVASWPGVTIGLHEMGGGQEFRYGRVELGHLHGDFCADLPFTRKIRDELLAAGRAEVHPPLPDSGWVRRSLATVDDAQAIIELFRLNYDRTVARSGGASTVAVGDDEAAH